MTVTKPTLDNANPTLSAAQAPTSQSLEAAPPSKPPRYRPLTIGIVAGEVSGDALGADLMRQMQNQQGSPFQDSSVIDGEAREVEPERKQLELKDVNKK